jgi:hypothetical protein
MPRAAARLAHKQKYVCEYMKINVCKYKRNNLTNLTATLSKCLNFQALTVLLYNDFFHWLGGSVNPLFCLINGLVSKSKGYLNFGVVVVVVG